MALSGAAGIIVVKDDSEEETMKKTLVLAAVLLAVVSASAGAQNWRSQYPTVVLGVADLNSERAALQQNLADYLSEETGVRVVLHNTPDYTTMIEDFATRKVHLLSCGPLPYATAFDAVGGDLEPLAMVVTKNNQRGYHIVMAVKGDSPYQKLDDLRGKTMACPDPNSTASYGLPAAYMDPDRPFFESIRVSGSHGKSILGVVDGTYDCAVTWAYSADDGNITRMIAKGQIEPGDMRIIWWSTKVPNHCVSMARSLPAPMRSAFREALMDFAEKDPERFALHNPGLSRYESADHEDYRIALDIRENQKRARSLIQ
jgi:phosphonate transport system substrate-binding protein